MSVSKMPIFVLDNTKTRIKAGNIYLHSSFIIYLFSYTCHSVEKHEM